MSIIIDILQFFIKLNDAVFSGIDILITKLPLSDWLIDALIDSIHMIPFLLFIFIAIEILEYYYAGKINSLAKYSDKTGPLAGSLLASIPQCGFSVIAATLYTKKYITTGTLLAVFLSTSDEALPVLLANPKSIHLIIPILITKILIAIIAGYTIDALTKQKKVSTNDTEEESEIGCCHHNINKPSKKDLVLHPIGHTFSVFLFIFLVTAFINYGFSLNNNFLTDSIIFNNPIIQPFITGIIGLIPNCAVSVAITLLYVKGAIGFGSVISGLCSGAGLGLLVLLRKNSNIKDTARIVLVLLGISVLCGIILEFIFD